MYYLIMYNLITFFLTSCELLGDVSLNDEQLFFKNINFEVNKYVLRNELNSLHLILFIFRKESLVFVAKYVKKYFINL